MIKDFYDMCEGLFAALDCLCLGDFIVESILFAIAAGYCVKVILRLIKMCQPGHYTQQQQAILKQCKLIHRILIVYLLFFELCIVTACLVYGQLQFHWFAKQEDNRLVVVKISTKIFWMLLYGYITILNIIFVIIAYSFLMKSKTLKNQKKTNIPFWIFMAAVIGQLLSYCVYFYLVIYDSTSESKEEKQQYLQLLRYVNLFWSCGCTITLLYIFCFTYGKKLTRSALISETVKRKQRYNILGLTILHTLRIAVEIFNLFNKQIICGWRDIDPETHLDIKYYYAIYLSIANLTMNIVPVFFILKVFKPPKRQFFRPSLMETGLLGSTSNDLI